MGVVTPVGNLTTSVGMAHLVATYYSRRALDRLQATTVFREPCMTDLVPKREGRTIQWYRFDNLSATTTPSPEGDVGTSQTLSTNIVAATLSQYSAFITFSTFLTDTAIDPVIESAADLLSYHGALSVDTITRTVIDNDFSAFSATLFSTYPTAEDVRGGLARLHGINAMPFEKDGNFIVILHPYNWFDIVNDPSANGFADLFKYTTVSGSPTNNLNKVRNPEEIAGVRWLRTTNVKFTSGSPNLYRMYMFARNGLGCAALSGVAPTEVMDPNTQKFKINVLRGGRPELYDPTGEIGGAVSYRFTYVASWLSGPAGINGPYRAVAWDCPTKLGL
ncbi:MAG: N4-gp56 family major capsid protein [bacterium JZ-2024 1]